MNIHEYQAAELLAGYGIPVNAGQMVTDADAAKRAAASMAGPGGKVALALVVSPGCLCHSCP